MRLKERFHRFRAWQKEPRRFAVKESGPHRCACCGNEFEGNYCPVCGQAVGVGRITWQSLWKNVTMLWGLESNSMLSSLWQLIWRPGYFIGEYLDGRRQVSYPPVKMLFMLAVFYLVVIQLSGSSDAIPLMINEEKHIIDDIANWLMKNPGWGILSLTMMVILPTWVLFRLAPRHPKHTLPEGVFLQVFLSSILIFINIPEMASNWFNLLIPFYYYLAYRQLFGYSFWGTLWRLFCCLLVWVISLLIFVACFEYLYNRRDVISFIFVSIAIIAAILAFGYLISKQTEKRRLKRSESQKQTEEISPNMVK